MPESPSDTTNDDELRRDYAAALPELQQLAARLESILERIDSADAIVESRIKSWDSIRHKLTRVSSKRLQDITDLVGVRVIVPDVRAFLATTEAIRQSLLISSWQSAVLQPEQTSAHFIVRDLGTGKFSAEVQVRTAAEDARTALVHELGYAHATLALSAAATAPLESTLAEFEALLLKPGVHEKRDIHPFLQRNEFLLYQNPDAVVSEVPIGLGTEFRIDFLVQKPDGTYLLIEIENPAVPLFTKSGDFAAGPNHALRQVEDWQEWIETNLPSMERHYPGIRSPEAWIVIGRDQELGPEEKSRLARRNINMRGRVTIKTYDNLLRDARAYVDSLGRALRKQ
jgi:ppGpp synthetase/RelA/SpoT-type nucleotidyltranferase